MGIEDKEPRFTLTKREAVWFDFIEPVVSQDPDLSYP
jgi:hypothetical protein